MGLLTSEGIWAFSPALVHCLCNSKTPDNVLKDSGVEGCPSNERDLFNN